MKATHASSKICANLPSHSWKCLKTTLTAVFWIHELTECQDCLISLGLDGGKEQRFLPRKPGLLSWTLGHGCLWHWYSNLCYPDDRVNSFPVLPLKNELEKKKNLLIVNHFLYFLHDTTFRNGLLKAFCWSSPLWVKPTLHTVIWPNLFKPSKISHSIPHSHSCSTMTRRVWLYNDNPEHHI